MDRVLYTLLAPIATGVLIFLKGVATDYLRRSKDRARKRKRQRVAALRLPRSQEEIEQQVAALRHLSLSEIEEVFGITDTTPRREEGSYYQQVSPKEREKRRRKAERLLTRVTREPS